MTPAHPMLNRVDPLALSPSGKPQPSPAPPSGSTQPIEGKYEVLAKLREGGMGAIYLVRHRLLEELRVIKVMRPELARDNEQRKRFLREARTATRLKHPNIVGFYDFFVDDEGTAYMVMEYIEGINLRDLVNMSGVPPVALAVQLTCQCLSALDYLHRKETIHRDISPDNVMMTEEGGALHAKLIDLGIAKLVEAREELTATNQFVGKLRYCSPEQLKRSADSKEIDERSDLFSLGTVLYEILTGICPFAGGSLTDILVARLNQPPIPFEESDPKGRVGPALRAVVMRSLERAPEARFQTAQQFSQALESLPAGERAPESPEDVTRYVRSAGAKVETVVESRSAAGAGIEQALRSKLRASQLSARALDPASRKLEQTLAVWSDRTPETAHEAFGEDQNQQRTVIEIDRSSEETGIKAPTFAARRIGVLLAAGVGAVFLVALGLRLSSKERRSEPFPPLGSGAQRPASSGAPDAQAQFPAPAVVPTVAPAVSEKPTPAVKQAAETAPSATKPAPKESVIPISEAAPPVLKPAFKERTRGKLLPAKREPATIPPVRIADNSLSRPKINVRYCSDLEETSYHQGISREVAGGFQDTAARAPRPDAGLMRLKVLVTPEHPLGEEPAFLSVRLENGGDNPITVEQVRESLSRGGSQAVANVSLPVIVNPGGVKELFQRQIGLQGGDPWSKQFVVIDKRGDSWKAFFHLRPCAE